MDPMLMIANSAAGGPESASDDQALDDALRVLRREVDVEVARTGNPGELDGVLHRAGSRTLVVAGGDGSLHAVIAALHKRHELDKRPLGLIPLGTGNDFARTLGIPLDAEAAAAALLGGTPRPMDLIVDEVGGVVVNNVHAGASAHASRYGDLAKAGLGKIGLGILGYPIGAGLAALSAVVGTGPFVRLRIEADGEVVCDMDRHVVMVAIGNGASVGGGTELNPEADPADGQLDVMISFATGRLARFGYALSLSRGEHEDRDDVLALRAKQVTISGEEFYLSADGEISGPESRRAWHLEAGAYSMILPT